MKRINVFLLFALAAAFTACTTAQATTSTNSQMGANGAPSDKSSVGFSKSSGDDGDLTRQLQSKFSQDPAFANVQVSVTNRTALITGSVASKADKKRAEGYTPIPGRSLQSLATPALVTLVS